MNQEEIYDERISPLMKEILTICKEHKIPMVASFACPNDDDPDLRCTSGLIGNDYMGNQEGFLAALHTLCRQPTTLAITTMSTSV